MSKKLDIMETRVVTSDILELFKVNMLAIVKQQVAEETIALKESVKTCESRCQKLEEENTLLREKISKLESDPTVVLKPSSSDDARLYGTDVITNIDMIHADIRYLKAEARRMLTLIVENNQYSRRTHVRINGIEQHSPDEDCKKAVVETLKQKLGQYAKNLNEDVIEAAHRIRKRPNPERPDNRPASIIVRFKHRDPRDQS